MAEHKTTPQIRFKGFSDDWELRGLGDEADIVAGGDIDKAKITESGKYPVLANALTNDGIVGYYENDYRIKAPAVTVTGRGDVGHAQARYTDFTPVVRLLAVNTKHDVSFLEKAINNHPVLVESTGVPQLTVPQLKQYEIYFPKTRKEEEIVGTFFKDLDNLIELHHRKYDKLIQLKKAMLEKMFPKNGSKAPEIRFTGFSDDWEECKLIDTVQITMGQSPDGSTYFDTPSDHILVQGNADLQNGWVVPRIWTTQITKKAEAGDLIMSVRAPAGTMGKTKYDVVIGRGVASIKGNEFIYQLLVKMDSDGYWKKLSCGSTFESLNSDNIKNAEIMIPIQQEQEKIGTFFKDLDNLIDLHQRKYDKLIQLKKAMLEKMFV
jgi:type I restriction enzyme S subunit